MYTHFALFFGVSCTAIYGLTALCQMFLSWFLYSDISSDKPDPWTEDENKYELWLATLHGSQSFFLCKYAKWAAEWIRRYAVMWN